MPRKTITLAFNTTDASAIRMFADAVTPAVEGLAGNLGLSLVSADIEAGHMTQGGRELVFYFEGSGSHATLLQQINAVLDDESARQGLPIANRAQGMRFAPDEIQD